LYHIELSGLSPALMAALPHPDQGGTLILKIQLNGIEDGPRGLRFPHQRADELVSASDSLWLLIDDGRAGPEASSTSVVLMHQSLWLDDGTLVSSTRLGLNPAVVDLRRVPAFLRDAVVGRRRGSELILLLPGSGGEFESRRILQVSLVDVIR